MSVLQWPVIRHVLHPVRSAHSAVRRGRRAMAALRALSIRRETRSQCWCGGALAPIGPPARHRASYRACVACGCYVNVRPPRPSQLARLYAFDLYWHGVQTRMGFPTIEERTQHDLADGRVDYWLDVVQRFGPGTGHAVEVGCAHGVLLAALQQRGYRCTGVEPDAQTAAWTTRHTGIPVRAGFFPAVTLEPCDLFLAFDVIEHVPDPVAFLRGARALLRPGGVTIIQTPVERHEFANPFSERPDFFDDLQHLYLFSEPSFRRLVLQAGFVLVALEDATQKLGQVAVLTATS
jgi:2-polyprenyl-3-methyl-5-hydroxy-6-metoxy-1,4-benzoquinol methylase